MIARRLLLIAALAALFVGMLPRLAAADEAPWTRLPYDGSYVPDLERYRAAARHAENVAAMRSVLRDAEVSDEKIPGLRPLGAVPKPGDLMLAFCDAPAVVDGWSVPCGGAAPRAGLAIFSRIATGTDPSPLSTAYNGHGLCMIRALIPGHFNVDAPFECPDDGGTP